MKKIMVANGTYKAKDGQDKTSWKEVGVIMTSQAGKEFVLLDPTVNLAGFQREAGKDKLIASIFDDNSNANQVPQQQAYSQPTQNAHAPQAQAGPQVPEIDIDEENIPF